MTEPTPTFVVTVIAKAQDVHQARVMAAQHLNSYPRNKDVAEKMLPTAASPNGTKPATHYLCTRKMTQAEIDAQTQFIATNPIPVTAHVLCEAEGTGDEEYVQLLTAEADFLKSYGLQRI